MMIMTIDNCISQIPNAQFMMALQRTVVCKSLNFDQTKQLTLFTLVIYPFSDRLSMKPQIIISKAAFDRL